MKRCGRGVREQCRLRAFASRWPSRIRPGGRGPDSVVPRHQCVQKPTESAHVDLVGCQTRRRANGTVVSEVYVGQMQVPIVLSLFDDHSQHLCQGVIYPLNAAVIGGMIGACSKLVHTQQLVYSL